MQMLTNDGQVTAQGLEQTDEIAPQVARMAQVDRVVSLLMASVPRAFSRTVEEDGTYSCGLAAQGNTGALGVVNVAPGVDVSLSLAAQASSEGVQGLHWVILCGENSQVTLDFDDTGHTAWASSRQIYAAKGAAVISRQTSITTKPAIRRTTVLLGGDNSAVHASHFLASGDEALLDARDVIVHAGKRTTSDLNAVGFAFGTSHLMYRGGIEMNQGVTQARGKENGRFITIGDASRVDAVPELTIDHDEVQCSHSFSISQIRPDELFYPMARGLSSDEARALILKGLVASVVSDERIATRVDDMLVSR